MVTPNFDKQDLKLVKTSITMLGDHLTFDQKCWWDNFLLDPQALLESTYSQEWQGLFTNLLPTCLNIGNAVAVTGSEHSSLSLALLKETDRREVTTSKRKARQPDDKRKKRSDDPVPSTSCAALECTKGQKVVFLSHYKKERKVRIGKVVTSNVEKTVVEVAHINGTKLSFDGKQMTILTQNILMSFVEHKNDSVPLHVTKFIKEFMEKL